MKIDLKEMRMEVRIWQTDNNTFLVMAFSNPTTAEQETQ